MALVGCVQEHNCGEIKVVEPGHTLSPWVKVTFRAGGGNTISVGNQSSPSLDNSAVIKSFNIGWSDGAECKIVIHDTMGSSISVFLKNMMIELKDSSDRMIIVQWGWTKSGCPTPPPSSMSKPHILMLDSLETNYIQGKFIHEIKATDTMATAVQGGVEKIYGEDTANGISLKAALKKLLTEEPHPIVKNIKYCRVNNKTGLVECNVKFKDFPDGPKHKWAGNAANKLEVAKQWVANVLTEKDKTMVPVYDSLVDGGSVIFWERPVLDCTEISNEKLCIGTYIVNGGINTPVIEFNPRIKWDFGPSPANGGQMADATIESDPQNKAQGVENCPQLSRNGAKGSGQVLSVPPTNMHRDIYVKDATKIKREANAKAMALDGYHIMDDGILADMVIVGDPTLPTQADGVIDGKMLAIAFVNPFHLMPTGSTCGDWLAKPPCNELLSDKNWLIQKMNHRIEGGTYTTSFSLRLTAPGYDTLVSAPVGNSPDGIPID